MAVRSAREAAYETIRSRIITMELKPGDELNDHELAQELGISRTPMREALIMLNIAHMVTIKPQSGTYVAPIDLELMEMEQFARFTLEKELPMAYVFYGQDTLVEHNKKYNELGIFLPNSHFLKHLEKHIEKAEAIIYAQK